MEKSKFSDEKIISIIREGDAGAKVADLCRNHGNQGDPITARSGTFGPSSSPGTTCRPV